MSEVLNPKIAEEFAKKLFENAEGFEKDFTIRHSEGVMKTCLKLAKEKEVDIEKLKIAAWLHDVGRSVSVKNHAEISMKLAEEKFGPLDSIIKDCILNHGNSKTPLTEEGKILQFADKLSILNDYEIIEMLFSKKEYSEKGVDFLKMVCESFLNMVEKYEWRKSEDR